MFRPFAFLALLLVVLSLVPATRSAAQEGRAWVQIEAHPDLETARNRARAYAAEFPETAGFRLGSGWYGIALGPYPADEAPIRLGLLKREGRVPSDSFVADGARYGAQFYPEDGAAAALAETLAAAEPEPLPEPGPEAAPAEAVAAPDPVLLPDETRAEARDSEILLTPEERRALQSALRWFGFYPGAIDGAFGPGTRNAMAAWQEAQGVEATGILTTRQRRALLDAWQGDIAAFGFTEVVEAESGITVTLPLGLVEFDRYEPPFVHYRPKTPDGPRIVLISQPGDQAALYGLYDVLQTLDSVPLDGPRERGERSFRIRGTSAKADTTVSAQLKGGRIKGWMLISTPGNSARDARIVKAIEDSFSPDGASVLDPGMMAMAAETRAGLLAGLEVRKPRLSRTGFFVTPEGAVLTTTEAVEGCARVTIDRATEARVTLADAASGLAVLTPRTPLSPRAVAGFADAAPRPGAEVAVPGYSYEDRLPAPVITFGTLEDLTGLNGETALRRLALQSLPGDAGGPVLDGAGNVLGMLLPASPQGGRQMPDGVAFALSAEEITRLLAPAGIVPASANRTGPLTPAALSETATDVAALVSCWE
ncbi:serine protease [Rhodobacter calidifons]|uniref:Peptidoglycan-binding protein n=1 Tax=Rhodobacter calidifons TaxID=2715277 RepID=A0ABX0G6H4_9RHOB|nr:serine protease [Rhodobacter calidifons]NHB76701.1 peptidoglycan-binding protein [Rhodobacter calidifons]